MIINDTAELFKALGDLTRLKILKIIASKGNRSCVGAVAYNLSISQPAVSQHLKILKNAGLVISEKIGYHVHYSIRKNRLDELGMDLGQLLDAVELESDDLNNCCSERNDIK